jgi:chaperonin GroES
MKKHTTPSTHKSYEEKPKTDTAKKIMPLGDRVLIKPIFVDEHAKSEFGIIIPDTVSKEKPEQGKVVAVGEGKYIDGTLVPPRVKVGDKVLFSKYGFDEVKINDEEFYILKEENILAIIK